MNEEAKRIYISNEEIERKEVLQNEISTYSSTTQFVDDTWELDKLKKAQNMRKSNFSLYFSQIPNRFKDVVKYFVLISLSKGKSYSLMNTNVYSLGVFFNYVNSEYNAVNLDQINKSILVGYEIYLHDKKDFSKSTKETIWSSINTFFKIMTSWEGMPSVKVVNNINPFSRKAIDRLDAQKYIPLEVINSIDNVFYNENVRHHITTIYWICRLIPSRINEVTTLPIDCLKEYRENEYTLTLHMYKQNGGYIKPELRIVHIKNEDMGKYLIDLIKKQQEISNNLQHLVPEEMKGFLFTYTPRSKSVEIGQRPTKKMQVFLLNAETARKNFNKILTLYNVVDKNNRIYHLTPHQLRHNAITDRIYEGFSLLEIRDMTAHKSNAMLEGSYIHPEKEQLKAIGDKVNTENAPAGGVYFKGKIINADNPIVVKRLLAKPRAHKIGRLGICSDITGCKNDMFECFSCSFFVPNADELDYFKEQIEQWRNKIKLTANNPLLKENAEYNLTLSEMIVAKIEQSIKEESENDEKTS